MSSITPSGDLEHLVRLEGCRVEPRVDHGSLVLSRSALEYVCSSSSTGGLPGICTGEAMLLLPVAFRHRRLKDPASWSVCARRMSTPRSLAQVGCEMRYFNARAGE